VVSIKDKPIVGVFCGLIEGGEVDPDPSAMKFMLADGRWVWTCAVAPHWLGAAGLFVDEPIVYNAAEMIEFWRIPLDKDKVVGT
jgi:hypothetical protein